MDKSKDGQKSLISMPGKVDKRAAALRENLKKRKGVKKSTKEESK